MKDFFLKVYFGIFILNFCFPSPIQASAALKHEILLEGERNEFLSNALLFSGNANQDLAKAVASHLGVELGNASINRFNDGEIQVQINESVRNKNIFIIQPTCSSLKASVNDNLMELFFLVRAMKRSSAGNITVVIPYYGYARQDRKTSPRAPISAADVALLLERAGVDRVVTIDLHSSQIQGFFQNAPVDNLYAVSLFTPYFIKKDLHKVAVVSPDAGGVVRAKKFAEKLAKEGIDAQIAIISKQRSGAGLIESMRLIGDVDGYDVILTDDMCDTAGTLCEAAKLLKQQGAKKIYAAITHAVFSDPALERIGESCIDEMVITDTIPLKRVAPANITCISCSSLLAEAIYRLQTGDSISALF